MSSIRELRNVTPETGGTQQSNSSVRLNQSVPANNASNPGNTGTVFSIRQLRGRTVPTPKLSPLTQPERIRPQAVVNPISERQLERQQARQRQNEVEQAAYVTGVGAALGVPAQEKAKFVQQGVGFLKSAEKAAEKAPKTEKEEAKPRGLTLDQYKQGINEAIANGDWTEADALARSLAVEPFSDENDYTKVASYYDDVFNRENLINNGGVKNEAITTARYIIDLADRSQWEELYLYMQSPDGAAAKKEIKDAFGIDADSEKSREGNYYGLAEQLQEAINTYGYDRLSDGASEYKTMLANNVFYRRAESTLQRAGGNEASSAQMDSYVRAQTAYYILDVLSGKLGVEDNGIPTKETLQNNTTKYLLDYLKDFCKVDLHGINEENYRKMIRDAMAETSQKAKTMGGVLQKAGYDVEAVREYSKLAVRQGFEQERYAALEKWKDSAKWYDWVAMNALTVPFHAYVDPITSMASVTSLTGKGSDTNDPNSYTPKLGSVSGTDLVRSATSEAFKKNTDWNLFGRNVASFLYNTGMSAVDSAVSALSFGNMSIFAMGTTAAGSEANNILSRGGSREQAFWGGIAAGVIEAVTEYVSVDKLLKNMGTVSSAKDWLKSVDQQMFTEGTEEMSSEVLNIIVDAVNMGNLSENSQAVKDYMENGFSYDEARTKVLYDNVGDVIESGLSGAISGGLTAGVTSAPGAIVGQRQQNAAKRIDAAGREIQQSASQQLQQTEQRAELVQENNPEAEVVKSHGTQLYLNAGTDLATAQSAGAVLDGILSGEITSENMSGKQADKLLLYKPYAAQLVSDALGVELQKTETKAQARAAAKAAVLAYEQRIKAVATQENNAPSSVQQSVNTSSVRNDIAAQTQETASAVVQDVQEQNSAPRPAAETAEQEALQMQSEQGSTRGDFYAQLPTEEGVATAPAGAMSYEDFKYRMRTDKEFRNRYTAEGAKGLSQEARNLRAYDLYQDRMGQMQSAAGTLSRTRFAEAYREINATKKNPAQDTEVDLAYQDYLEMQQDRTVTESEQDTVPADYVGLVENEISAAVPQEVREAVDALAKQFGLQISYEDIGSDNGYYIPGTNRVVLDINPVRSAVDDAGRSAYLFTVAHEVGHYARENMSEEAWESFEAHAVAAMGGETAVSAKMQEAGDDGNSIYNTEDLAREDVACDFLGKILSDKDALKQFCDAIRDKTVSQPAARGILGAIRKVLAKLAGNKAAKRSEASVQQSVAEGLELFAEDIEAGRKAASEIADALAELAKQPRPLMNSKQAEAILAEAKKSNKEAARKTSGTQSNIDNAADLTYNKNENGGDQNVSNRMDQGLAEGVPVRRIYDNRDAQARGNGRGHQGILRRNLSKSLSRAFNESGVVAAELYSFDGDRAAFSSALDAAREADAKNGWCVTPQSAEELSGKLTFMDDGSTIGFVLTDSGDIEGVFKNPEKNKTRRAMSGVMPQAIAAGGTKLDCYGTRLVRLYENYGFVPVARVEFNEKYANPGWDASKGKPDIFFMMHNGDSAETVVSKIGTYPHMSEEQLNSLPRYGKDGYDEAMAYRDGLLAERNNASVTSDTDIRRSRKDIAEFTQNDVKVSVSDTKDGYSLDVDGEKSEFVWKRGIDGARQVLYNKSGKRSAALQEVVQRLHSGDAVPVEEVMSLPEVELANKLSEADATFNLPNREAIRKAGYEKAMSLGSYNSKTGKLDGRILRERRMDVVIGLPGSGKSSVYSNRLSEEHGERIIDTDDFREYIPDYNGLNASVVHQEASLMRDMVLDEATQRGENILLSTVGANAKSLANKIRDYTSDGYSVYLHLNELPYLESVARVLERYVSKDGRLGRIVSPDIVFGCKNAPTQTYLEITGQEEYYGTLELGEEIPGSRGMGGSARARDVRTETERTRTGEERSAGKGENDVSDLLSGFDWYNNNVKYGEEPIVVQANREAPIQRMSDVRRSRKDRQNETARTAPGAEQRNEILNERIETIGQLERSTERAIKRKTSPQKAQETLEKTDAEIAGATKQMPRKSIGLVSKAKLEAIDRQHEEARAASAQREAETVFFRRVAGTARTQAINDEVRLIRHAERAERRAERIAARYNERIDALKQQVEHNKRQASLERTFREDAEKSNRALGKGVEALSNDLKNAEQAAQKSSERATAKHEKLRRDAEHNKRQASLESTFRRQTEKENRELNRQAERLRKERDRAIRALQMDTLLRAKGNQQALEAIRGWRHNGHIGRAALAPNEVDTRILTKKEQATLQREPAEGFKAKANALQNRMKGVSQKLAFYFTSERLPFEEMARLQDRVDSIDTAVLAMDNSKSMTNAILTDSLRASDGSVIDGRSVMEVLGCWVDDKVGGKIDEDKQRLFDRYLYMMHSVDRMSAVKNARDAMLAFLNRHPEFKQYVLEYFNAKGEAKSKSLTIRSTEVIRMAAEGNQAAQEFITLAQAFAAAKDKPVFGTADGSKALGAETSKIIADEIAEANPWVKEKAEEFYAYWDKFMQEWYVGKTGTQEQYDAMKKLYPHYVPTYRAFTNQNSSWSYSPNGIGTKNAVSAAKGSTADLNTVGDNVARQVERLVSVARQAELFSNVYQEVLNGTEGFDEYAAIDPQMASLDSQETELALFDPYSEDAAPAQHEENAGSLTKDGNVYTWKSYFNGEQRQMLVSDRVYESLLSMTNANKTLNKMAAVGNTVTRPMKTAITGVNVSFAVRNILRDFYTAIVNSVAGSVKFTGYYFEAITKMVGDSKLASAITSGIMKLTNTSLSETERESIGEELIKNMESARLKGSKEWNDFVALGGTGATRARSETGFLWNKSAKGKIREAKNKTLSVLGAINEFTESIPRFAEYLATIGIYGDTAEGRARGIKNAAEVTVDFSRHGKAGKVLNAYIPYWNPQIQGMAKMYRSIRFPGEGNKMVGSAAWKQRGLVLSRAFVTSVVPRLLQIGILALAGDDDWEEWDELTDRMKDTYFLIPMGDGKFFKLPYGRDWGQIFGSSFSRIAQGILGREDNWDNFFDAAIMANFNPLSLPIGVQEIVDILRNEDFAGRAIVPYNMTEVESTEAYDEETSRLSVLLAKGFPFKNLGVSPVQIDYLISSYFGDYGDMLIEATDEDGLNGLKGFLGEVLAGSFVADSAYSSSTMSKYYELLDDLDSSVKTAKFKDPVSYKENLEYDLQRALEEGFGDEISDLNKRVRETEDENETRALKYQIQELAKQALDFAEKVKSGEITDPVNYVKYDPYGATVRDTIIRMTAEEGDADILRDFAYLPSESIPDIEGHDTTDEEKARYKEIYQEIYTEFAVGAIETETFKKATLEEQAAMLEGARELAGFYAKKEWATEFGLKSFNKFGRVTYDPKTASSTANIMFEGGIPADKVGSILRGISDIEPLAGADSVSSYQKYDYILGRRDLDKAQRDAALVSYMSAKEKERYDACAATGVSATTYVTVLSDIHNLTPLAGRDGVTSAQKWEVCIKAVSSEEQQDALLNRYMDTDQAAKYEKARSAGVAPKLYVKYCNAKYTYGNGNGSWTQAELQSWLDANVSSTSQKAVLWELTNSGWKNNPYR